MLIQAFVMNTFIAKLTFTCSIINKAVIFRILYKIVRIPNNPMKTAVVENACITAIVCLAISIIQMLCKSLQKEIKRTLMLGSIQSGILSLA